MHRKKVTFGEALRNPRLLTNQQLLQLLEVFFILSGGFTNNATDLAAAAENMQQSDPALFNRLSEMSAADVMRTVSYVKSATSGRIASHNTAPRASRYAAQHANWLRVAKQAASSVHGTTGQRKRTILTALRNAAPGVRVRTLSAFVDNHGREIFGDR